jgi:hypothetical protein
MTTQTTPALSADTPESAEYIAKEVDGEWVIVIPNSSVCVMYPPAGLTERQAKLVTAALNDAFERGERRRSADILNLLRGGDK